MYRNYLSGNYLQNYLTCASNFTKGYRLSTKIERKFLLIGIQQTKFDMVMSIDVTTGNDPMRQQR